MKLHKEIKQHMAIPIKADNGYYKCTCGNRLVSYQCQEVCEICKAKLDWDQVEVVRRERCKK